MEKCSKCGSAISDNDVMAWKCMECGKAFKVNLCKLKKLQVLKNKPENTGKMLLKCPTCGNGIDNGNEKIACKCSTCGNVMMGNLRDFVIDDLENKNIENILRYLDDENGKTVASSNLIKCPECGRENVSKSAESCPGCGYGIKAHFDKIKFDENLKKIETERIKRKKQAEIEYKKHEDERIKNVPMPLKPKISIIGTSISALIIWFAFSQLNVNEYERKRSMNHGNGDPVFYGFLFLIIGIAILCYVIYIFMKQRERYNLAKTDFAKYQRIVVKEQDEYIASQKAQAEATQIRQLTAPKCPLCGSINIERISTTSRVISVAAVGLASGKIGKQYKCKNCKHMW